MANKRYSDLTINTNKRNGIPNCIDAPPKKNKSRMLLYEIWSDNVSVPKKQRNEGTNNLKEGPFILALSPPLVSCQRKYVLLSI